MGENTVKSNTYVPFHIFHSCPVGQIGVSFGLILDLMLEKPALKDLSLALKQTFNTDKHTHNARNILSS